MGEEKRGNGCIECLQVGLADCVCVCVSEWGMSDRVVYGSVDNANGYLCLCLGAYVRENDIIDK